MPTSFARFPSYILILTALAFAVLWAELETFNTQVTCHLGVPSCGQRHRNAFIFLIDSAHNTGSLLAVCWRIPCQTKDAIIQYVDEIPRTIWEAPSAACQGKGSEAASLLQTACGITSSAGPLIAQTSRHRGEYWDHIIRTMQRKWARGKRVTV